MDISEEEATRIGIEEMNLSDQEDDAVPDGEEANGTGDDDDTEGDGDAANEMEDVDMTGPTKRESSFAACLNLLWQLIYCMNC